MCSALLGRRRGSSRFRNSFTGGHDDEDVPRRPEWQAAATDEGSGKTKLFAEVAKSASILLLQLENASGARRFEVAIGVSRPVLRHVYAVLWRFRAVRRHHEENTAHQSLMSVASGSSSRDYTHSSQYKFAIKQGLPVLFGTRKSVDDSHRRADTPRQRTDAGVVCAGTKP